MEALPLLTASRMRDARACRRKHHHRYIDGYAPIEDASPLRFGTMFHVALEAWWKALRDEARAEAELFRTVLHSTSEMLRMLRDYMAAERGQEEMFHRSVADGQGRVQ